MVTFVLGVLLLWVFGFIVSSEISGSPGEVDAEVEDAMRRAWEEYGSLSARNIKNLTEINAERKRRTQNAWTNGPVLLSPHFQPMTSDWDSLVSPTSPIRKEPVPSPGIFNYLLAQYIYFDVNHYNIVYTITKIGLGTLLGTLLGIWVLMGFETGFIPIWFLLSKTDIRDHISLEEWRANQNWDKPYSRYHHYYVESALNGKWLDKIGRRLM